MYPVVADPVWVWMDLSYGAKCNRYETSRVRDFASAFTACALLAKRAPPLAVGCGAYAGYMTSQANLAETDRPKKLACFSWWFLLRSFTATTTATANRISTKKIQSQERRRSSFFWQLPRSGSPSARFSNSRPFHGVS